MATGSTPSCSCCSARPRRTASSATSSVPPRRSPRRASLMKGTVPPGSPPALAADTMQGRLALLRGELDEAERLFTVTLAEYEARKLSSGSVVMLLHLAQRSGAAPAPHRRRARRRAARARHGAQAPGWHSMVEPHRPGATGARRCLEARPVARRTRVRRSLQRSSTCATRSARSIRRRGGRSRCRAAARRPDACVDSAVTAYSSRQQTSSPRKLINLRQAGPPQDEASATPGRRCSNSPNATSASILASGAPTQ